MEITLPDLNTSVVFRDHEGSPIAEVELVILDELLHAAVNNSKNKPHEWPAAYANSLSQQIGRRISPSVATFVAKRVTEMMRELKKSFDSTPKSPSSTGSTPSPSLGQFYESSTPISDDSAPSENSVLDKQPPPSQPTEPLLSH